MPSPSLSAELKVISLPTALPSTVPGGLAIIP
jgi:hypothetical protein